MARNLLYETPADAVSCVSARIFALIRSAISAGVVLPPQALALIDGVSTYSLFNSLKKAGLTLEPRKAPLEVLVIDQIQKTPTEN